MKLLPFAVIVLTAALGSCSRSSPDGVKHYAMTGKVVSIDAKEQAATIDAAAIPNFMEAMTMDYPVKSKADFGKLHAGDQISGTVDVSAEGGYSLSNIQVQRSGK